MLLRSLITLLAVTSSLCIWGAPIIESADITVIGMRLDEVQGLGAYESLAPGHLAFGKSCGSIIALIEGPYDSPSTRVIGFDLAQRRMTYSVDADFRFNAFAIEPRSGRYFALSPPEGKWVIYDFARGSFLYPNQSELRRAPLARFLQNFNSPTNDSALGFSFDRSGTKLAVNYASGAYSIYDLDAHRLILSTRANVNGRTYSPAGNLDFNHDGTFVVNVTAYGDGEIVNVISGDIRGRFTTAPGTFERLPLLVASQFGNHFVTVQAQEEDADDHAGYSATLRRFQARFPTDELQAGREMLRRKIQVWEVRENGALYDVDQVATWTAPAELAYNPVFAFTPDHLVGGSAHGDISFYHSTDGAVVQSDRLHRQEVTAIAVGDIGSIVASGSRDGEVVLFHAKTRMPFLRLVGNTEPVFHLTFSPDERRLIVSTFNPKSPEGFQTQAYVVELPGSTL